MKKYYVNGFLFSEDYKQVALIRKNRPDWQRNLCNGIGGKIEIMRDESPLFAMIREFKEEAGVEIKTWKEYCKYQGTSFEMYCFKATGDLSKLTSMTDEKIEIISVDNLHNEDIIPNLNWLINLAIDLENPTALVQTEY